MDCVNLQVWFFISIVALALCGMLYSATMDNQYRASIDWPATAQCMNMQFHYNMTANTAKATYYAGGSIYTSAIHQEIEGCMVVDKS